MKQFSRLIKGVILDKMASTSALLLSGPRSSGKRTLTQQIAQHFDGQSVTLDELEALSSAIRDPKGFLRQFSGFCVINEAQRAPALFTHLENLTNSRFLLTCSSHVSTNLAKTLKILPLSSREALSLEKNFIDAIFSDHSNYLHSDKTDLTKIIAQATFPQLASDSTLDTANWFQLYFSNFFPTDPGSLVKLERSVALFKMLRLFASRIGQSLNESALAAEAGINTMTFRRHRSYLESVYLLTLVPPWHTNTDKRLSKSHKIYLSDTLGATYLLDSKLESIAQQKSEIWEKIMKNFVACELLKQLSLTDGFLSHFQTYENKKIDFIIEKPDGRIAAIDIQFRQTVSKEDFQTIELLQKELPQQLKRGIVLYLGDEVRSFGNNHWAMPLSSLWSLKN